MVFDKELRVLMAESATDQIPLAEFLQLVNHVRPDLDVSEAIQDAHLLELR